MTKAPCYDEATKTDCPIRCEGCHSRCNAYLEYEKIHRKELEELSTRKNNLSQVIEFGRARYDRAVNKATNGRKRLGYR